MKQLLKELIEELIALQAELLAHRELLSLREYSYFLTRIVLVFLDWLLTDDRENPTDVEVAYLTEMLNSRLMKPLNVTPKLEREMNRLWDEGVIDRVMRSARD